MNKLIITLLIILTLSACSTTNKYDVEIAQAKYEYGKQINEQKPMFEIKGELRCSEAQLAANECGLVVYNQNQRYINVDPQSPDRFGQVLDFAGKLVNPLFNWKIAQSNNELSQTLAEQNTELFSTIFTSVTDMQGTGVNYNYTDSYNTSDSYNSQDTANTDSYNTSNVATTTSDVRNTSNASSNDTTNSTSNSYNSDVSKESTSVVTEANDNVSQDTEY